MTAPELLGRVLPVRLGMATYGHVYQDRGTWTGEKVGEFATVRTEFVTREQAEEWVLTNPYPAEPALVTS